MVIMLSASKDADTNANGISLHKWQWHHVKLMQMTSHGQKVMLQLISVVLT